MPQMPHKSADLHAAEHASPKGYVCHKADRPIRVTGGGDDPQWSAMPWTDDFVDIQGPPEVSGRPTPRYRTRVMMCYCDRYLYLFAQMEEPDVCATLTEKNVVIFQDNDFEVFIDPDGDNTNYHEYEVNALGTIWELTLPQPYRTGAQPINPDNIHGLISKVKVCGELNSPNSKSNGWTVELAIPFAGMSKYIDPAFANHSHRHTRSTAPGHGEHWRINFSRVQWRWKVVDGQYVKDPPDQAEDNWVWSPQGVIDMHRPATWGYLQFSELPPGQDKLHRDPALAARNALMGVWERMLACDHQPSTLGELIERTTPLADNRLNIELRPDPEHGWIASTTLTTPGGHASVHVCKDARLWLD